MTYREEFAARLSSMRTNAGLSQKAVADVLGVSAPAVTMMEKAKRSPSFEVLCTLADYFDVSLDYLVGRSDDPVRR